MNALLNPLFDKKEEEVKKFANYLQNLCEKNIFSSSDVEEGFSTFFKILPDIESDFPHMPDLLSSIIFDLFVHEPVATLENLKLAVLPPKEDLEYFMAEIFVKIIAVLLKKIEEGEGEGKAKERFNSCSFAEKLKIIEPYVFEENLKKSIGEDFGVPEPILALIPDLVAQKE